MGALLDAAVAHYGPTLTVADPFSGGGTVTFEAARRGVKAYAQDLYPWPTRGLAAALNTCDKEELAEHGQKLLAKLNQHRIAYRTQSGAELSHILRVRIATCVSCENQVHEYPHALVSLTSRAVNDNEAYFGCRACGELTLRKRNIASFTCGGCKLRWQVEKKHVGCPHCSKAELHPFGWRAVLVQELVTVKGQLRAVLRPVAEGDPVEVKHASDAHQALLTRIPAGKETNRLVDNGLKTWGDLYTLRQADVLVEGLQSIAALKCSGTIKDRLAFALLGTAEMPAFLSRWDRFHLKPFEGMANHRYTQTTLAVESNFLSPVGRGTIPRRLEAAVQALQWLVGSKVESPKVITAVPNKRVRRKTDWDVLVTTGSSACQALQTGSVSVVVTDPPYFDDVQYGELARLFHVWLSVYDPNVKVDESAEAVPNSIRGTSTADYESIIASCLAESRRTLQEGGRIVLTFHNKKMAAWRALAGAIGTAGLKVTALAAVLSENDADHCKRNVDAMLHDLVIECSSADTSKSLGFSLEFTPKSTAEKNLAAMGMALAECVAEQESANISAKYLSHLDRLGARSRFIK
ncbi:hypothetical protein ACN9MY_01780 [Pseudoduganella sp. R-31]|uniref:hypothetical protein n=1 Tax=Pseudoduganella sp. R-31 TaxID=3404060 RepID=UPI003CE83C7B